MRGLLTDKTVDKTTPHGHHRRATTERLPVPARRQTPPVRGQSRGYRHFRSGAVRVPTSDGQIQIYSGRANSLPACTIDSVRAPFPSHSMSSAGKPLGSVLVRFRTHSAILPSPEFEWAKWGKIEHNGAEGRNENTDTYTKSTAPLDELCQQQRQQRPYAQIETGANTVTVTAAAAAIAMAIAISVAEPFQCYCHVHCHWRIEPRRLSSRQRVSFTLLAALVLALRVSHKSSRSCSSPAHCSKFRYKPGADPLPVAMKRVRTRTLEGLPGAAFHSNYCSQRMSFSATARPEKVIVTHHGANWAEHWPNGWTQSA